MLGITCGHRCSGWETTSLVQLITQRKYSFQLPMSALVRSISGTNEDGSSNGETIGMPGQDCLAHAAMEPLSMEVLVTFQSIFIR